MRILDKYDLAKMFDTPGAGDALSLTWGKVTAINPDGSINVQLPGGGTVTCADWAGAAIGGAVSLLCKGSTWIAIAADSVASANRSLSATTTSLQGIIDALPRYLSGNVAINVSPGEYAGLIRISRFYGPGSLFIYAVDSNGSQVATAGVQTHKCTNFAIEYCTCAIVHIQGFTATSATADAFSVASCTSQVRLYYCTCVASASRGVYVTYTAGLIILNSCTVSNRSTAVYCQAATLTCVNMAGTGNATVYSAQNAGMIQEMNVGAIAGTNRYTCGYGGTIHNANAGNYTQRDRLWTGSWATNGTATITVPRITNYRLLDVRVGTFTFIGSRTHNSMVRAFLYPYTSTYPSKAYALFFNTSGEVCSALTGHTWDRNSASIDSYASNITEIWGLI